jgi:hypothetical protein
MKQAIDVTGRPVDPSTVSDIVQMVKALLPRKAGSQEGIPDTKSSLLP